MTVIIIEKLTIFFAYLSKNSGINNLIKQSITYLSSPKLLHLIIWYPAICFRFRLCAYEDVDEGSLSEAL